MRLVTTACIFLCLTSSTIVLADTGRNEDRARELSRQAQGDFNKKRYREALRKYQAACRLAGWPQPIFNIAQCHHELGEKNNAVQAYRSFLDKWKEQHTQKSPPFEEQILEYIRKHSSSASSQPATNVCGSVAPPPPPPKPPLSQPSRLKRPWAWIVAGVGAAGIGVGVALLATRRVDEVVQEEPEGPLQQVTDSAVPGAVVLGVGVASAVLSVFLFAHTEQPVHVGVSVMPGVGFAVVTGRY